MAQFTCKVVMMMSRNMAQFTCKVMTMMYRDMAQFTCKMMMITAHDMAQFTAFNGHSKTAQQWTIIGQYGDWYTGR